jgi:hypothetical protein
VLGEETDTAICPDWYPFIQAAKYLGTDPLKLIHASAWWTDIALTAISAEATARKILEAHR